MPGTLLVGDFRRRINDAGGALVALGLVLAALIVFSPLRHAGFLNYDDSRFLLENEFVRDGLTRRGAIWALTSFDIYWQPLTWFTHMADFQFFGPDPAAHHRSSVLLHALNSCLLLWALVRLTGMLWRSAAVAALFALHPLHVEPVAWISARNDLLGACFFLWAILAYVRYAASRTAGNFLPVVVCLLLGVMSKGTVVTLPLVLLLLDYWPLRRRDGGAAAARGLLAEKIPLFLVAAAGAVVQVLVKRSTRGLWSLEDAPLAARVANAAVNYGFYAWKTVVPAGLAVPYPARTGLPRAGDLAASLLFLAAVTALATVAGRRRRYLVTGWLWYLVTLLPVVGFVQFGHQAAADRYTYLPLIGLFLMIAWGSSELAASRAWPRALLPAVALLLLAVCAVLARGQAAYWQDGETLFRHALRRTRDNYVAENNLGRVLADRGRVEEAREHFAAAVRINPKHYEARSNLGALLTALGELDGAERELREALRLAPEVAEVRINLGTVLLRRGDGPGAREQFAAAVQLQPDSGEVRFGLAQALDQEGRLAEALAEYERAVALAPDRLGVHHRFGQALEASGRRAEAVEQYREELRLHPGNARARRSLDAALEAGG